MNIYLYQKYNQYFAQHASGAEIAAKDELLYLGAKNIKLGYLGYFFEADNATIYKIVYCTRILSRVLAPIIDFKCHSEKYLYKTAQQINWEDFITLTKTFSIKTNVSNSNIKNSQYATQILKDCIVDQFKKKFNKRPNVDTRFPDLSLNLYIHENRARISLDLGGSSLHKRGYRKYTVDAPMKETLAATIIRLSEWDKTTPIYDPFCGSGTILFEAAMHYCEIPAAFLRSKFGFLRLPDFDNTLWNQTKSKINKHIQSLPKD